MLDTTNDSSSTADAQHFSRFSVSFRVPQSILGNIGESLEYSRQDDFDRDEDETTIDEVSSVDDENVDGTMSNTDEVDTEVRDHTISSNYLVDELVSHSSKLRPASLAHRGLDRCRRKLTTVRAVTASHKLVFTIHAYHSLNPPEELNSMERMVS